MSGARGTILDRVDRALNTAHIPPSARAEDERGSARQALLPEGAHAVEASERSFDKLQDRFVSEARALGVEAIIEMSEEGVRRRLASLTNGLRVLAWDPDQLPFGAEKVVRGAARGSSPREEQAAAEAGVTGCHAAIAETGSLALLSLPGCSRAASLLPPLHVALVRPRDLFFAMGDFFEARRDQIAAASNCTFVTGPSRTADIELSLTIGVHGPGRVVVIVGP